MNYWKQVGIANEIRENEHGGDLDEDELEAELAALEDEIGEETPDIAHKPSSLQATTEQQDTLVEEFAETAIRNADIWKDDLILGTEIRAFAAQTILSELVKNNI